MLITFHMNYILGSDTLNADTTKDVIRKFGSESGETIRRGVDGRWWKWQRLMIASDGRMQFFK